MRAALCAVVLWAPTVSQANETAPGQWSINGYAGLMTTNRFEEIVQPGIVEIDGNSLAGISLAYDRQIKNSRWSMGFELQLTSHFGTQEYFELSLPVTIRYRPESPWIDAIHSFAFGLGGSHATEVPLVEVESRGGSRRNLIYWMLETEFEMTNPRDTLFVRIHHRSDAWGLLEPEGGSNAVAFGYRRRF